jgi:dipeptidyl aminopeptidase/acylaminoacyl peptidase
VFAVPEQATAEDRDKIARTYSPVYGISPDTPPTLIIHGDADTLVPIQQSRLVMAKLEGVEHRPQTGGSGGQGGRFAVVRGLVC